MRDGAGFSTNIYLTKYAANPVGAVFVRTPYNFDAQLARKPANSFRMLKRLQRNFAYCEITRADRGKCDHGSIV